MTESPKQAASLSEEDIADVEAVDQRIDLDGRSLREHTARGTIVNAGFQIGLAALEFGRRFLVIGFLTAAEFGFWGLLLVSLSAIVWLKQVGVGDKYVQHSEADQELAFQRAFTIELLYTLLIWVLTLIVLPLYALIYGLPEVIGPGALLSLALIGSALQTPTWIWYRRMDFVKQRTLLAIDPVVSTIVTVPLAIAGLGYWSLVIGAIAGSFSAAGAALVACPYRIRFRLDRGTLRDYYSFSWPIALVSLSWLAIVQVSTIAGEATVGLAGVGAIGVAGVLLRFADQVDRVVTTTIYPAVCAVRDKAELLFEVFTKTNRVALMWAVPAGIGLSLFAADIVHYLLGDKWAGAIGILQAFGVITAAQQIAFNWTAFMRAVGRTRPMAANALLSMATFMIVGLPLMLTLGLAGYSIGMAAVTLVSVASRVYFLRRLFGRFPVLSHSARAILPTLPAAAAVLALQALEPAGPRSPAMALVELAVYVALVGGATLLVERALVREALGYLRGGRAGAAA
jgi:PST family polysaccharide transporter